MKQRHLTPELVESIFKKTVDSKELSTLLIGHLLQRCSACAVAWQEAMERQIGIVGGIERVGVIAEPPPEMSSRTASWRVRELLQLPPGERQDRMTADPDRFGHPEVARLLIEEARGELPCHAAESGQLARLACAAAAASPQGDRTVLLFARATAYLANSLRCAGRLQEADDRMLQVRFLLQVVEPSRLIGAEIESLEASLRRAQRRLREAVRLLERAIRVYRREDEREQEARLLINLSTVLGVAGLFDQGIASALRASGILATLAEPQVELELMAVHNTIEQLTRAGRHGEAAELLDRQRQLYDTTDSDWWRIRKHWMDARIASSRGEAASAIARLAAVRELCLEHGNPYEAAMVDLERAALLLDRGRFDQVQQLADEMAATFREMGVAREATAAALLFVEAARRREITLATLERLAAFLEASQHDPALTFERFEQLDRRTEADG